MINTTTDTLAALKRRGYARKAAGAPWEFNATKEDYQTALDSASGYALKNRGVTQKDTELALQSSRDAETVRYNNAQIEAQNQARQDAEKAGKTGAITQIGTTGALALAMRGGKTAAEKAAATKAAEMEAANANAKAAEILEAQRGIRPANPNAGPTENPYKFENPYPEPQTPPGNQINQGPTPTDATVPAPAEYAAEQEAARKAAEAAAAEAAASEGGGMITAGGEVMGSAEEGFAASGATEAGGASFGNVLPVIAAISAIDANRQSSGQLDRDYADRTNRAKMNSVPVTSLPVVIGDQLGMKESNELMKPLYNVARTEEKVVGEPLDLAFKGEIEQSLRTFGHETYNTVESTVRSLNPFCFVAGTPILMEDKSLRLVESLQIGEVLYAGGLVWGTGVVLASSIYAYRGIFVEGGHAVFEDGVWVRVKDSPLAVAVGVDDPIRVYPIISRHHLMISGGIIFADLSETDDGPSASDAERLAALNANTERNEYLKGLEDELSRI
jgi:hypothetical protein